jgi:long-subunit acyl-CoA synthetase (AMP-forming)
LSVEIDDGEIVVEGPSVMDGYLHGDLAARCWRTGDIGALDADGYLTVYGRRDNLIVLPNGRNISPEWIETMLAGDPRIGACVLGQAGNPAQLAVLLMPSGRGAEWFAAASRDDLLSLVEKACLSAPEYARPKAAFVIAREEAAARGLFTANGRIRRTEAAKVLADKAKTPEANHNLEVIR